MKKNTDMKITQKKDDAKKTAIGGMAITPKGLKLMLAGVLVMVSGYILMCGGASEDPQVFSYAIFDFRRLVAAPLVIIAGIIVEIIAIMGSFKGGKGEEC